MPPADGNNFFKWLMSLMNLNQAARPPAGGMMNGQSMGGQLPFGVAIPDMTGGSKQNGMPPGFPDMWKFFSGRPFGIGEPNMNGAPIGFQNFPGMPGLYQVQPGSPGMNFWPGNGARPLQPDQIGHMMAVWNKQAAKQGMKSGSLEGAVDSSKDKDKQAAKEGMEPGSSEGAADASKDKDSAKESKASSAPEK